MEKHISINRVLLELSDEKSLNRLSEEIKVRWIGNAIDILKIGISDKNGSSILKVEESFCCLPENVAKVIHVFSVEGINEERINLNSPMETWETLAKDYTKKLEYKNDFFFDSGKCGLHYKILAGNRIQVSFSSGYVHVFYYETAVDEVTGYPLMLDDPIFITAVCNYVRFKAVSSNFYDNRQNAGQHLQFAKSEWENSLRYVAGRLGTSKNSDDYKSRYQ